MEKSLETFLHVTQVTNASGLSFISADPLVSTQVQSSSGVLSSNGVDPLGQHSGVGGVIHAQTPPSSVCHSNMTDLSGKVSGMPFTPNQDLRFPSVNQNFLVDLSGQSMVGFPAGLGKDQILSSSIGVGHSNTADPSGPTASVPAGTVGIVSSTTATCTGSLPSFILGLKALAYL